MNRKWINFAIPVLLLVLAVAALYARTAGFAYLRLDDWGYTAGCPFVVGGLAWQNVADALSRVTYGGIWMPLTYISYAADITLFGGGWGVHHAVNAALHALNAITVFFFVQAFLRVLRRQPREEGGERIAAFAAAFLWAVHPQRVEAVAWIASRKEELWTLWTLLGLMAWGARRWALGWAACLLACLSKPTAVCFPLLAIAVELAGSVRIVRQDRFDAWRATARYLPLFLMAAVTGLAAIGAQTHPEGMGPIEVLHVPLASRIVNAAAALGFSIGQFFLPVEVHFDYMDLSLAEKCGAIVFLAVLVAALAIAARRMSAAARRMMALCAAFFLCAWLPVSGVLGSFGSSPIADRFLYMPMVAASLGVAAFLAGRRGKAWHGAVFAFAVAAAALSWPVVSSYRNDFTAFSRTLAIEPDNWRALQHVGSEYCARLGRMDEGIDMMRRSLRISPHESTAEVLAYSLACRGNETDAAEIFRLCAKYARNPQLDRRGMFAESLGIASLMIKRYDAAIAYLNISIAAKDRFYSSNEAKFRLAEAYALAGESAAARSTLRPLSISDDKPTRLRALRALDEL